MTIAGITSATGRRGGPNIREAYTRSNVAAARGTRPGRGAALKWPTSFGILAKQGHELWLAATGRAWAPRHRPTSVAVVVWRHHVGRVVGQENANDRAVRQRWRGVPIADTVAGKGPSPSAMWAVGLRRCRLRAAAISRQLPAPLSARRRCRASDAAVDVRGNRAAGPTSVPQRIHEQAIASSRGARGVYTPGIASRSTLGWRPVIQLAQRSF